MARRRAILGYTRFNESCQDYWKNYDFEGTRCGESGKRYYDDDDLTHAHHQPMADTMTNFSDSRMAMTPPNPNAMTIDFDFGCVLGLISNQYRTLLKAILEAVQNSLDAGPRRINLNINMKAGRVIIQDDGCGASKAHMRKCLLRIGKTLKGKDKLGQFGIGVVASFGKCRQFTFTTQPVDKSEDAFRLIFNCKAMGKAVSSTDVPCVFVNIDDQWWNSQLEIEGINTRAQLSLIDLDTLCDCVYKSFALAMKKHNTTITVRLTTTAGLQLSERSLSWIPFQGSAHKTKSYTGSHVTTTFKMFTVYPDSSGRRRGQGVRVVDSGKLFSKELTCRIFPAGEGGASLLSKGSCNAITSGIFEGEIQLSNAVKLDSSRNFFVEDDASTEAALHIESWLADCGMSIIKTTEDEANAERYRELADKALISTDALLKAHKELASLLRRQFKWGSQGDNHTITGAKYKSGFTGKRAGNKGGRPPGSPNSTSKKPKGKPAGKKTSKNPDGNPNDIPLVTDHPSGPIRAEVLHDSTGLRIHLVGGDADLWALDKVYGKLTINIAHDTWTNLDKDVVSTSKRVRNDLLVQLQKRIIQAVLNVLDTTVRWGLDEDMYHIMIESAHEDTKRFGWSIMHDNEVSKAAKAAKAKAVRKSGSYSRIK